MSTGERTGQQELPQDWSPGFVHRACEASLSRLGAIQRDDLFATLEELKAKGKIRPYGVAAVQTVYNLLEQEPGRRFFPLARHHGAGVLVRVPHSSGLLEGHFTEETTFPAGDHRSHRPREWLTEGLKKVERLRFLEEGTGRTLGQAALKFVLAEETVASALPNIYSEEQVREFARTADVPDPTAEEMARLEALCAHAFSLVKETAA